MKFSTALSQSMICAIISVSANGAIYFLFGRIFGLIPETVLSSNGDAIAIVPVIILSFITSILAGITAWVFAKYLKEKAFVIFRNVAWVLCILSFANPFVAIPNVPLSMAVVLNLMHVRSCCCGNPTIETILPSTIFLAS